MAAGVLLLLLTAVAAKQRLYAKTELINAGEEIRVGLTALYSGKQSITIENSALGIGYCVGRSYLQETVLYSTEGFTFTPASGYFVCLPEVYGSYSAAGQVAAALQDAGYAAYPVCVYQCTWYVYVGGSGSYSEMETLKERLAWENGCAEAKILPGNNYRIWVKGSFGTFLMDVDSHMAYPQFRPVTTYEDSGVACVDMGTRVYRGRMEIGRYNKATLTAVNIVPIEEYLYSVVASEMPSVWHNEALKAQAVCSRSYALIKAGYSGASNAKKGYKMVDTTSSQVYKGYLAETAKATAAVKETKGEMVCYGNQVVAAYFFSTSGGRTESSKEAWAVEKPYLVSVTDLYETNPAKKPWLVSMTKQELGKLLELKGMSLGTIQNVKATSFTDTGRVYALLVTGTKGETTIQESAIRTLFGLYSTKFKIVESAETPDLVTITGAGGSREQRISDSYLLSAGGITKASASAEQYIVRGAENLMNYPCTAPADEDTLLFAGMGYGHGVGMSQSGAQGMAEAGFSYKEIIEYYFTGAKVR
ncbi:MAG: SpoIID/LytB domain-containing protein [Lachnospiraceae bacterium]